MAEYVVLVDVEDRRVGTEEKIEAHKKGLLHRAFSIFVFNSSGLLLLQKRNSRKYHCGDLWSNTCCSHPKPGERLASAAHRRLKEEMNFDCELFHLNRFIYKSPFKNGLIENEVDHVYCGVYNGEVRVNFREVSEYKWIDIHELKEDIELNCNRYTPWLYPALGIVLDSCPHFHSIVTASK